MSAAFDSILAEDAAALISEDGEFAETISFSPRGGGAARTIYAIVDREPAAAIGPGGMVQAPKARFEVRNHATLGILLTEIEGGKISYNRVKGNSATLLENVPVKPAREPNHATSARIRVEV